MAETPERRFDLVVVGSGIAGLYAALQAHDHGASVLIVTKGSIDEASTRYAQGGIAAAVGAGDSPEAHLRDTIEAGAGLVDEEAARILTSEAAVRVCSGGRRVPRGGQRVRHRRELHRGRGGVPGSHRRHDRRQLR